jgi:S-adenosylmethionine/arginine decarboxylase-like enzyme
MTHWGYHLMLDCSGMNNNICNKQAIEDFTKELIQEIEMEAVGDPTIYFLSPEPDNSGYSLMQMIQTSNITAHFVDQAMSGYIDVFSCRSFDINKAEAVVQKYFSPTSIRKNFLTRQA